MLISCCLCGVFCCYLFIFSVHVYGVACCLRENAYVHVIKAKNPTNAHYKNRTNMHTIPHHDSPHRYIHDERVIHMIEWHLLGANGPNCRTITLTCHRINEKKNNNNNNRIIQVIHFSEALWLCAKNGADASIQFEYKRKERSLQRK